MSSSTKNDQNTSEVVYVDPRRTKSTITLEPFPDDFGNDVFPHTLVNYTARYNFYKDE